MGSKLIGDILKQARKTSGKSVREVSELLKEKGFRAGENTIYSWENNNSQPTPDALLLLCELYGINDVLATFGYVNNEGGPESWNKEQSLIRKYRDLDAHGRKMIELVLEEESKRIEQENHVAPKVIEMKGFTMPASAGRGIPLDGCEEEMVEVPVSPFIIKADFVIRVSGDSMSPFYNDGDILLVREQDYVEHGEVGIFILNGEGYVKRFYNKDGDVRLKSINIDYEDIIIKEYDSIKCRGKVIAKS